MKELVAIRKLDDLYRVVVPREMVKILGWEKGDQIEIKMSDATVTLEKYGEREKRLQIAEGLEDLASNLPEAQRLLVESAIEVLGR